MFRLDRACEVSAFTDTESSRYYALGAVRFRPPQFDKLREVYMDNRKRGLRAVDAIKNARSVLRGSIEATDGRMLICIPTLNGDKFPSTPGSGHEPSECLIPATHLKKALQGIPAKHFKPVLQSARITMAGDMVVLSTTDLERASDQSIRQVDGRFPRTDEIWPDGPVEMSVCVDARLIEKLAKHARTHGETGHVTLALRGSDSAIEFSYLLSDDRQARGLLMPMPK